MVSSTFTDLRAHREKIIESIRQTQYVANVMEVSGPNPDNDVLDTSLQMVRDSVAYIGIIGKKYGAIPIDDDRNPEGYSLTELEFREAQRLERPIILFVMSEDHDVKESDIEFDPDKRSKLQAFREYAKRMREGGQTDRIYQTFNSLRNFSETSGIIVGNLARRLDKINTESTLENNTNSDFLPAPPALVSLPKYLGSHKFVGRQDELKTLGNWSAVDDPNPILLFEAIGGSGKSMLTWEWLVNHATQRGQVWKGRFWYSFYERGAVMADFCRHALAYMTQEPVQNFARFRTEELANRLVDRLENQPWLLVLDGLERILVAYHRHDAAQLPDDAVEDAGDAIVGNRDPRQSIRPQDDDLLRRLTAVSPSKILISSRLTPKALLNAAGLPLPGVRRERLTGLQPADAEALFRACGVTGTSSAIRHYLKTNCGGHPLVVGVLAGLVNDYPADRGNFDMWAADTSYGLALKLSELDLTQKRNHILNVGIDALSANSLQALQTLAMLQAGANYTTLSDLIITRQKPKAPGTAAGKAELDASLRDLEHRGLVQYDSNDRRYDLHPVVRGVASGRMEGMVTEALGKRVVDHFTAVQHAPWEGATTLDELAPGIQVVRAHLQMRDYQAAYDFLRGDLLRALITNLGNAREAQALLSPHFPDGWRGGTRQYHYETKSSLLNDAASAIADISSDDDQFLLEEKIGIDVSAGHSSNLATGLRNLSVSLRRANKLADDWKVGLLTQDLSEAMRDRVGIFKATLNRYATTVTMGQKETSDLIWRRISEMGRNWPRSVYRAGALESFRAIDLFQRGDLTSKVLDEADAQAVIGLDHAVISSLKILRGRWLLDLGMTELAVESLEEAVKMARESGREDSEALSYLTLARARIAPPANILSIAHELDLRCTSIAIAEIWEIMGERDRAISHARKVHAWAAADGIPYVRGYDLKKVNALIKRLGVSRIDILPYVKELARPLRWEAAVKNHIAKVRSQAVRSLYTG